MDFDRIDHLPEPLQSKLDDPLWSDSIYRSVQAKYRLEKKRQRWLVAALLAIGLLLGSAAVNMGMQDDSKPEVASENPETIAPVRDFFFTSWESQPYPSPVFFEE